MNHFLVWAMLLTYQTAPQLSQPTVDVEKLMTPQELVATGVGSLSRSQKAALNQWLTRYTNQLLQQVPSRSSGEYAATGTGHWVKKKVDRGDFIVLEDNSLWEIMSIDRIDTMLWLPTEDIIVLKADYPVGEYKYVLINTDSGDEVTARYRGK